MHLYLQVSTSENFNIKHRFLQKCFLNSIIFLSFNKSVSEIYNNPTLTSRKGGAVGQVPRLEYLDTSGLELRDC